MFEFYKDAEPYLQLALNTISLFCAVLVLIFLGLIAFLYKDLFNRVTIRFQGILATIDVIRHINIFLYGESKGSLCLVTAFVNVFGKLLYIFIGAAVAMNLHVTGIRNIRPAPKMHIKALALIMCIITIMGVGAYVFGAIGKDSQGNCALREDLPYSWVSRVILLYLPAIPGISYCLFVSIMLIQKFWSKKLTNQEIIPSKIVVPKDSRFTIVKFIKKLYLRVALVPLFCALNLLFYVAVNLVHEFWPYKKIVLSVLSRSGLRLAGIMNLLSLVLDPYFQIAVQRFICGKNDDILAESAEKGFSLTQGAYADADGYYVSDLDYVPDEEDLELLEHYQNLKLM